ncbi:hypothetical protein VTN77DRAFT_3774 [Rasamsonia byssochlamydoides]|uniref:uncharacterized protein n=1 Tax=Rasamsonia byssochlamydoides TaxID=89139 RepID=UPI003742E0C1
MIDYGGRRCSICFWEGQVRRTCLRKSPGLRARNRCSHCHQEGHRKDTCPDPCQRCSICGAKGHTKSPRCRLVDGASKSSEPSFLPTVWSFPWNAPLERSVEHSYQETRSPPRHRSTKGNHGIIPAMDTMAPTILYKWVTGTIQPGCYHAAIRASFKETL